MTISVTACNIKHDEHSFIEYQRLIEPVVKRLSNHTNGVSEDPCSFVGLPFDQASIDSVLMLVKKIGPVDGVVVVGIGGSNLASRAVETALLGVFNSKKKVPVWWADTVDQAYLDGIISSVNDLFIQNKRVILVIVSKSGTTFETTVNEEIFSSVFKKHYRSDYPRHVIYGSNLDSPLAHKARQLDASFVPIPASVGGRFSAFSSPHLLILALAGVDIDEFCKGAVSITPMLFELSLKNPAFLRAVGLYVCSQNNVAIHDLFIPGILWTECGNWMRQLIGESLGKRCNIQGSIVHTGLLPTVSMCSTDLHSVGQLYVEGPLNRVTTFFDVISSCDVVCNESFFSVSYSRLMRESMHAVMQVYQDLESPFFCVSIPQKNAYHIGQIMQTMMVEVVFSAALMNVNPFDQPGVQLFKKKLPKVL